MELRVLRYFLAVAREENITKAAALLHVTQPTLSRQLMYLENELGVKLFRRSQYRVVLTDDGMLLRRRAQEIIELADKAERELQHHEEELTEPVDIGRYAFLRVPQKDRWGVLVPKGHRLAEKAA